MIGVHEHARGASDTYQFCISGLTVGPTGVLKTHALASRWLGIKGGIVSDGIVGDRDEDDGEIAGEGWRDGHSHGRSG